MADITDRRINIQQEETKYRASVSEATLTRVGASINFVNKRQFDTRGFFLNGPYGTAGIPQTDVDGAWGVLFDIEIVGIMMFNHVAGFSGTTTLDLRRYTASNTPVGGTSIFSTKPSLSFTSGNNAFLFKDVLNNLDLQNPTGATMPVVSTVNLNAGDMVSLNVDAAQTGGENCGILVYFRPR